MINKNKKIFKKFTNSIVKIKINSVNTNKKSLFLPLSENTN